MTEQYNPGGPVHEGQPYVQEPPPKKRRWVHPVAYSGVALLGVIVGAAGASGGEEPAASAEPQPTFTVTLGGVTTAPAATVTKTVPPKAKTIVRTVTAPPPAPKAAITEDGVYLVGVDIKPGTYRQKGNEDCYWARLANLDGDLDSINANSNGGNQVVQIKRSDKAFETKRCGEWVRIG